MKYSRLLQLTTDLLNESEDEAIRCFHRDIQIIREYYNEVLFGTLVYGQKGKFRTMLSEKHNISIKAVEDALFGKKRIKVRDDIIREIKNANNKKRYG